MVVVAGIDVSKATLEISVSEGPVLSFENSTAGIRRLLRHLERAGVTKAVCESTGGYERLAVGKLREKSVTVQVAHPVRVRAFARACGYEAKTDPLDAQVLSRYGVVFSESDTAQPEVDPDREELRQLLSRRRQLVDQRVRERNRLDKGLSGGVGKSTRRHIRWLDGEIERLDEEYKELLKHNASLGETVELYQTVPGVGQLTAATLVAYLPELGRWDGRALTSLVGLAPWSRDSGKKRGNRSIRGGRGTVRRALYICAWAVLRIDGDLRDFYRRLRERGKPGKVATVAVARKLLMQINAVARRGTPWVKQHGSGGPSYQADPA
ncbi:MAG: IS110 family transposase [Chloroflexi bacterium]|nr:IS110 family transposase [Chloroflexota bacterium]